MIGSGTQFHRSEDGTTYTRIGKIMELNAPEQSRASSEKTYLDNSDNYKSFEPGMIDPGEMTISLEYDPDDAAQNLLKNDFNTKSNFYYKITYPDGSHDTFQGHITAWGKAVPKEETIQRNITFKVTGQVTETASA